VLWHLFFNLAGNHQQWDAVSELSKTTMITD